MGVGCYWTFRVVMAVWEGLRYYMEPPFSTSLTTVQQSMHLVPCWAQRLSAGNRPALPLAGKKNEITHYRSKYIEVCTSITGEVTGSKERA